VSQTEASAAYESVRSFRAASMSPPNGHVTDGCFDDAADVAGFASRLQALDREAWKALYLQNRRLVRGVLAARVGFGPELEDLLQQVFATAATLVRDGRVSLRGDAAGLRSWLVAVAIRLGFAEHRRRRAAPCEEVENAEGAQAHTDPVARQTLRRARSLWQRLPERLQVPWLLRRLEHMTIDEIAAALSISAATAKRRITEADGRFEAMAKRDPVVRDYLRRGEET
jgi:RNA polymerase sigma factor (sigma-70 family)